MAGIWCSRVQALVPLPAADKIVVLASFMAFQTYSKVLYVPQTESTILLHHTYRDHTYICPVTKTSIGPQLYGYNHRCAAEPVSIRVHLSSLEL